MAQSPLHVLVIGGGIGGLCLAQGLRKAGLGVAVYERDRTPTSRIQGYRIHISPRGSRALKECLPPELWRTFAATCGKSSRSFRFLTHRMGELLRIDMPDTDEVERHFSASRITLRQVLLAGLDGIVHFDKAFTRFEESPDGRVAAFFEDGTTAEGDLLVAADGGNSRVRKQFLPHAQRVDTGIRAIGGKVILNDETRPGIAAALLQGPTLVRAPAGCAMFLAAHEFNDPTDPAAPIGGNDVADGAYPGLHLDNTQDYLMWALSGYHERSGFPSEPGPMDRAALRDFALKVCTGWHPQFAQMIRMTDASTISLIPIRTAVPVDHWQTGRITLIGDAIHSMTPYRGIGGNVALRDASLLCRNLAAAERGEMPLLQAIRDYETAMLAYGFDAVRTSLQAAVRAHSKNPAARIIGNTVFRVIDAVPRLKARMFAGNTDD